MNHPFTIGETFANRNGTYEVVMLDEPNGNMRIRYTDSGDEQEVQIQIQARIWNNMIIDDQMAKRSMAERETRQQRGYGESFTGLKPADFKMSTDGTTWRSRSALGGLVARLASIDTPYTYISWSIYRWPVIFLTHYEDYRMAAFDEGSRKAKFTVEVDTDFLYFGFYIERADTQMDNSWDWSRLITALSNRPELVSLIEEVELRHSGHFIGRKSNGSTHFHFANGLQEGAISLWDEDNLGQYSAKARIELLTEIQEDFWGELYILSKMHKNDAIDLGTRVAYPIAELFRTLTPLYRAASSGS